MVELTGFFNSVGDIAKAGVKAVAKAGVKAVSKSEPSEPLKTGLEDLKTTLKTDGITETDASTAIQQFANKHGQEISRMMQARRQKMIESLPEAKQALVVSEMQNAASLAATGNKKRLAGAVKKISKTFGLPERSVFRGILATGGASILPVVILAVQQSSEKECWKWEKGEKVSRVDLTMFSDDDNMKYCACSPASTSDTPNPTPLDCSGYNKEGETPTYITCDPWNEPTCTYDDDTGDGFYYATSKISLADAADEVIGQDEDEDETARTGTGTGDGDGGDLLILPGDDDGTSDINIAQLILIIVCILISFFFVYEGVMNKEWIYGVGVLIVVIVGIIGSYLI